MDGKERDGGWEWELHGEYNQIWEIRPVTCVIGLEIPRSIVITRLIGTCTWSIGNWSLTCTRNSPNFQFRTKICPILSHPSLSHPQPYHRLKTWRWVIPLHLPMPWSRVNTEYSIHGVQHTPSIEYPEYSIHRVGHVLSSSNAVYCIISPLTVSHSQPVSHLFADHVVLNSIHSHQYQLTNAYCLSSHRTSLPNYYLQIDPIQILHQSHLIKASKCISNLARSWPPSASPHLLDLSIHVNLQTSTIKASKCISKFAWLWPPS